MCKHNAIAKTHEMLVEGPGEILLARESCDDWLQQTADSLEIAVVQLQEMHLARMRFATKCRCVILFARYRTAEIFELGCSGPKNSVRGESGDKMLSERSRRRPSELVVVLCLLGVVAIGCKLSSLPGAKMNMFEGKNALDGATKVKQKLA